MLMKQIAVAAGVGFSLVSGAAKAAIVDVVTKGTVSDVLGIPSASPFGAIAIGTPYTVSLIFNTDLGISHMSAGHNQIAGGSNNIPPTDSPNLLSSVTINGITVSYVGDGYGYDNADKGPTGADQIQETAPPFPADVQIQSEIYSMSASSTLPGTIDQSFSYTVQSSDIASEYFLDGSNFEVDLRPQVISLSLVPLPSSAPMFGGALLALGALGCGLRRKARVAA